MFKWNDYKYLFVGMEEVAISTQNSPPGVSMNIL